MTFRLRPLVFSLFATLLVPFSSRGEPANEAISRATAAIQAAAPRAQADSAHPIFHVTAPAQWINDPNGPIYYKGFYHLFYQLNPFSDGSGPKYWGHVRSRDLATWEHLPVALWPSSEAGEAEVWSGCCTINGRGEPMIFYTSIAPGKSAQTHAEQWAAIGDDDLIQWRKSPANPVLTEALHNGRKIYDWRDPFIFHDHNKTFMVTGGNLNEAKGGQAVVNIYEAENAGLTQWKYRGVLFKHPDSTARTSECPNFFKLGDRWVLFVSPYGKVQYFVGDFDAGTCRFQSSSRGLVDFGPNFYAPNTMQVPDGRRLVWGWVTGLPGGHGWNGCLTVPRLLSLSHNGQLLQNPAPQLSELRGKAVKWRNIRLENRAETLILPKTNTLEIRADIDLNTAKSIELGFVSGNTDAKPVLVNFNGSELKVMDAAAPMSSSGRARRLNLRIFIDRSVLEIFANEIVCFTKVIAPLDNNASLEIRAQGGAATARLIQAWPMKTIW
jgi:beta-fructofuranosidase